MIWYLVFLLFYSMALRRISTVSVAAQQKELDQKSKALRELDAKIQAANWTADLMA